MEKIQSIFSISQDQASEILSKLLSTGGTFAECFMETTKMTLIEMTERQVSKMSVNTIHGAALRIIKDDIEVNASTTRCDFETLCKTAEKLSSSFNGKKTCSILPFVTKNTGSIVHPVKEDTPNHEEEIHLLQRISEGAYSAGEEIKQVRAMYWQKNQHMGVFASDGTWEKDHRCNTRVFLTPIASDGTNMQPLNDSQGANAGLEQYIGKDLESWANDLASDAIIMLHAEPMVGGDIPVVLNNGFGGVILHEACVHGLEATSVAKGQSVFCGKLGTKIASDIVNAVDSGVDEGEWGSLNVDDEGTLTKRNLLIENGILKSYLVDKKNSKKMNHPITGSSRRQSYKWNTTSRMTNTYFLNGKSTFEEIIASTKYGLFAKKMGGGSVNPSTGEFNFAVDVGYLIEDGKITKPVKGATLVGSGKDVLLRIDMIGNNLACSYGMCGSMSGSIPTCVGQPTIRVSHITVGGRGGK